MSKIHPQKRKQIHIRNGVIYSVNKMQELAKGLAEEKIKISELDADINEPLWKNDEEIPKKKYSMNDVIKNKDKNNFFRKHYNRATESDLSIPILIDEKHKVIDGYHRVLRAILENREYIQVKKFSELPKEAIVK